MRLALHITCAAALGLVAASTADVSMAGDTKETSASESAAPPAASAPAAKPADAPAPAAASPANDAKPADAASPAAAPTGDSGTASAGDGKPMTAYERVKATEKGKLKNPYKQADAAIVEEGRKAYLGASCNGCHGGGGGGGMCPPVTNETWVYGGDDDTLFRLITLGTDEYKKEYKASRVGQETVVGPMPGFKDIVTDEAKLWKMITFIRSVWAGRAEKKTWE